MPYPGDSYDGLMKFCEFFRSFLSAVYIPSFQLHIVYPDIFD